MRIRLRRWLALLAVTLFTVMVLWNLYSPPLLIEERVSEEILQLQRQRHPPENPRTVIVDRQNSQIRRDYAEAAEQPVGADKNAAVPAWSLSIGEPYSQLHLARQQIADLRALGFHPYLRRHHSASGVEYGIHMGPWLSQSRAKQALETLKEKKALKYLSVKLVHYQPPSVFETSASNAP